MASEGLCEQVSFDEELWDKKKPGEGVCAGSVFGREDTNITGCKAEMRWVCWRKREIALGWRGTPREQHGDARTANTGFQKGSCVL